MTGGGITFSNLFQGWPESAIATVHNDPEPTTNDVCRRYYRLGRSELRYRQPFDAFRQLVNQRTKAARSRLHASQRATDAGPRKIKDSNLRQIIRRAIGGTIPDRAVLTPTLEAWIGEYSPDVLYTILGSNGMMGLIDKIQRKFALPVIVHIMDDWPSSYYRSGLLGPVLRRSMKNWVDHFFQIANSRLAISEAMAVAYTERYGHSFQAYQNTIDIEKWSAFARTGSEVHNPVDVLYVGSIFPNAQLDALVDCCEAVALLNRRGRRVTLTISSPSGHTERYKDLLLRSDAIHIEPTIKKDEDFFKRIASADLLLLPVNFDADSIRFIRYSMPTKVPAYLVSGTPILAYGSAETAQIQYAQKMEWGQVLTRKGVKGLADKMEQVFDDTALRLSLSQMAMRVAQKNHDQAIVRTRFQNTLRSVWESTRRAT